MIEVLEGGWPWLPLLPFVSGLATAWRLASELLSRWSLACLLTLAWAILPLRTKLPWYSHRSGCPLRSSVLRCWPGWWFRPSSFWWQRQPTAPWRWLLWLPVLVRGTAAPAALAEQLQQHRQQPWALPQPGCAGPRLVWRRMVAALWRTTATTPWGDQPQLRQCGDLALLFHSPLWLWELNETWPCRATGGSPGQAQPWRRDLAEGLRRTHQPNWYAEQRIQRFRRWPRAVQRPAEGLHHRRPSGVMEANCR